MGKWFLMLTFLNMGALLVCFGLMSKENACAAHLVSTFMNSGYCFLWLAAAVLVVCLLHAFVVIGKRLRTWSIRTKPAKPITHAQTFGASTLTRSLK